MSDHLQTLDRSARVSRNCAWTAGKESFDNNIYTFAPRSGDHEWCAAPISFIPAPWGRYCCRR